MAFALQWHTAYSGADPIVAATERPQFMDSLPGDVLVVTCEIRRGNSEDTLAAGILASDIVKAYSDTCPGAHVAQPDEEIARRMVDAVAASSRQISPTPTPTPTPTSVSADEAVCNVLAVAVYGRALIVARSGYGQVYLLRSAELQHLTGNDGSAKDPLEVGKLELKGDDRVLVCTSALSDALKPLDLQRILKAQPSSRRTAQALLRAAEQTLPGCRIGLAVIDFISGKTGVFPVKPDAPSTRRSIAALPLAVASLAMIGAIVAVGAAAAPATPMQSPNPAVSPPSLAQVATDAPRSGPVVQSLPAVQAGVSVAAPMVVEPVKPVEPAKLDDELLRPMALATAPAQPTLPHHLTPGVPFLERDARTSANPGVSATSAASSDEPATSPLLNDISAVVAAAMTTATEMPAPQPTAQATPVKRLPRLGIAPRTSAITLGDPLSLDAEMRDENGMVVTTGVVTWQPSEVIASTGPRSAVFNASTGGTYTVTASLGDAHGQATVVVLIPLEAAGAAVSATTGLTTATTDTSTQAPPPTPIPAATLAPTPEQAVVTVVATPTPVTLEPTPEG